MVAVHESSLRRRSGFVAAFLSLLFPGLGHAYLGAYRRGLGFAAPPLLIGALLAGIFVRMNTVDLVGMAVQGWFLTALFIANLVALAYRAAAIIDAWAIARVDRAGSRPVGAIVAPVRGWRVRGGPRGGAARHDRRPSRGRPLRPAPRRHGGLRLQCRRLVRRGRLTGAG